MKKRKIMLALALAGLSIAALSSCGDVTTGNGNGTTEQGEQTGGNSGENTSGNTEQTGGETDVTPVTVDEGAIKVIKSVGAQEACYATFEKLSGVTDYNAYIKKSDSKEYTLIDKALIREYSDYYRVDALGLKAGSYDMKLVSVIDGSENTNSVTTISNLTVVAHDRSGFGFVNGSSSGAYNDDGTLKSNARVIYVNNANKDTVETTAIESKATVTKKGIQNIISAMKSQKGISDPVCIRLIGNILDPANMPNGDLYIDGVKNLTIEGIGSDATANGFGIVIKNSSNVEIRNIGFMNCNSKEGDDCGLQQQNDHVWVHNCDFFYGDAGSDADQVKGDGALDTKKSTYVTHSYNHFWDNGKCNLQGMKDETIENYITYHHNWYDHSDSRHPRVRTCTVHVYNNYFDGNAKYGIASAVGASIFAENNYFRSTTNTIPFLTGQMGHDIKSDGTTTLSSEYGGVIKEYGNVFDGDNFRYTKYSDDNNNFDAYNASSRDEVVASTVKSPSNVAYNNFDTNPSIMYSYTVETAEAAKNSVMKYAGRLDGGDVKWTFDNSEDANYEVISGLKAILTNYKNTSLVKSLGIEATEASSGGTEGGSSSGEGGSTDTPSTSTGISSAYTKTFDNGVADDYFTITADLKSNVASKTYNGVTYTSAIKMESSTNIKFTLIANLTLVIISDTASKSIKINGTKYSFDANGILELNLEAATYEIVKGDSMNVYAFILK